MTSYGTYDTMLANPPEEYEGPWVCRDETNVDCPERGFAENQADLACLPSGEYGCRVCGGPVEPAPERERGDE